MMKTIRNLFQLSWAANEVTATYRDNSQIFFDIFILFVSKQFFSGTDKSPVRSKLGTLTILPS